MTSASALAEAERNLDTGSQRGRLEALIEEVEVIREPPESRASVASIDLPPDDRPILAAAIAARCSHLLSGDRRAFGVWYGRQVDAVTILRPVACLRGVGGAEG